MFSYKECQNVLVVKEDMLKTTRGDLWAPSDSVMQPGVNNYGNFSMRVLGHHKRAKNV
jgi:hypothetical protein